MNKKILIYDLETTSDNVDQAKIVQIAYELRNMNDWSVVQSAKHLINPGEEISYGAYQVHGIGADDVKDSPAFEEKAMELKAVFDQADIICGYNNYAFDDVILMNAFSDSGIEMDLSQKPTYDVFKFINEYFPRTLTGMYRLFTGNNLEDAHDAGADVLATAELAQILIDQYAPSWKEDISKFEFLFRNTLDRSGKLAINDDGEVIINFGKHKGKTLLYMAESERPYLEWICKSDFPKDFRKLCLNAMQGIIPKVAS